MKYTFLGRTGLKVSRLCLGTMNFGAATDEKESFAIMDRALELGINFYDTADRYGNPMGTGATEKIIGRWLAQGGGRGSASFWQPKSTVLWDRAPTTAISRRTTSGKAARQA